MTPLDHLPSAICHRQRRHPSLGAGLGVLILVGVFAGLIGVLGLIAHFAGWWFLIVVVIAWTLAVFGPELLRSLKRRYVRRHLRRPEKVKPVSMLSPDRRTYSKPETRNPKLPDFRPPQVNGHHKHERKPL